MTRLDGSARSQHARTDREPATVSAALSAGITPALFTTEQAATYLGMSEAKFHELRGEPWMCAPIPLGPRLVRWAKTDLDAAIAAMPRQAARSGEPTHLLRAKVERLKTTGTVS
jgi:predicted DNA-binding transcriptional regulator AlpA